MKLCSVLCFFLTATACCPDARRPSRVTQPRGVTENAVRLGCFDGGTFAPIVSAYFENVNARGGINGRSIKIIFAHDASLAAAQYLTNGQGVAAIFGAPGTVLTRDVRAYLARRGMPLLFATEGLSASSDTSHESSFSTLGFTSRGEGATLANIIKTQIPGPRIGILYENTSRSKEIRTGVLQSFGDIETLVVAQEQPRSNTDYDVRSAVLRLKNSGANVFLNLGGVELATAANRCLSGWKPAQFVASDIPHSSKFKETAASSDFTISALRILKDPADPHWTKDPAIQACRELRARTGLSGEITSAELAAYATAEAVASSLVASGPALAGRRLAQRMRELSVESNLMLPGVVLKPADSKNQHVLTTRLARLDRQQWTLLPGLWAPLAYPSSKSAPNTPMLFSEEAE